MSYKNGDFLFDIKFEETFFYDEKRDGFAVTGNPERFRKGTKEDFERVNPRVYLTVEQAIDCLPDTEYIHTFSHPRADILLGCDLSKKSLIEDFTLHSDNIQIGGPQCRSMGHGLVLKMDKNDILFIEAKEEKLKQYDIIPTFD